MQGHKQQTANASRVGSAMCVHRTPRSSPRIPLFPFVLELEFCIIQVMRMEMVTGTEAAAVPPILQRVGERLYRETAYLKLSLPIKSFCGRLMNQAVFYERDGHAMMRKYVVPADPRTAKQLLRRSIFGQPQRQWLKLTREQADAWKAYALRYHPPVETKTGAPQTPYFLNRFTQVQCNRHWMGLGMPPEAPTQPPPPRAIDLTIEPAPALTQPDTTFAFRISHCGHDGHGGQDPAGMRVLIQLTPATQTLTRKPRMNALRCWHDEPARCYVPLKPSGELYVLEGACIAVASGRRFGVRIRLVSEEGVPGPELARDFIKP